MRYNWVKGTVENRSPHVVVCGLGFASQVWLTSCLCRRIAKYFGCCFIQVQITITYTFQDVELWEDAAKIEPEDTPLAGKSGSCVVIFTRTLDHLYILSFCIRWQRDGAPASQFRALCLPPAQHTCGGRLDRAPRHGLPAIPRLSAGAWLKRN